MYGYGQSDGPVVPANPPNMADAVEVGEERGPAKGNTVGETPAGLGAGPGVSSDLSRVREVARRDRRVRFTALLHHVDLARLWRAYRELNPRATPGVDRVTWQEYGQRLMANLEDLHTRVQQGRYRAVPARRAYIPKADGKLRPLGIASLEDKIVQRAVVEVLNAVYEQDFKNFSYGFRPGRGPHHALDALSVGITRKRVNWVLDADISDFFGSLDHDWMRKFLRHRIADPRVLRLIDRWLTVGVVENGERTTSERGSPQGASLSPLLANVYLHYVFDLWADHWRKTRAEGDVIISRYADDFVVGFEHEQEARQFLTELRDRFAQFGLELHPSKTRLIEFGRHAARHRAQRGVGKPDTFDFLGFTHISVDPRRSGRFWVKRITIVKRMRAKLKQLKIELRRRRHWPTKAQARWLRSVIQGHLDHYAVPGNWFAVRQFRTQLVRHWFRSLRRRSQRGRRLNWARMNLYVNRWLPPVRITHPFPNERFDARYPRQEPSAVIPLAGICAGGRP
jgi:RNA-directed DNA polymerase